ncbi:MAG TPA: DUF3108 domain-containing protein [Burkholderiales bacterium]|jgi:hypothetical protein
MSSWSSLRISVLAGLFACLAGAAWGAPPRQAEVIYETSRNGLTLAEVTYTLEHDGRNYQIAETTKGRGILALRGTTRRTSRGMITPEGLKPVEFTDERTGRNTARASFDWKAKTVTLQYKGDPRTEPLPPNASDRLAFVLDFSFAPQRREAVFDLFDGRGQSHHVYTNGGNERIKIPLGEFDAVRFFRGSPDDRSEVWLAKELGYLPVRVLVTEKDGTRYEQVATKITTP